MNSRNRWDGVDDDIVWLIRDRARKLIGRHGFLDSDIEDLEQEIVLDLLIRLPKCDPTRARLRTFGSRLVDHKIADIIRTRKAAKRDYRLCSCSLNEELTNEEGAAVERLGTIDQDEYLLRIGKVSRPIEELRDLEFDVSFWIEKLPVYLRHLCEHLKTDRVSDVARKTGISRSTIYRRLEVVHVIFKYAGLGDYLGPSCDRSESFVVSNNQGRCKSQAQESAEAPEPDEPCEQTTATGGEVMDREQYRYDFDPELPMKEVEDSLMLAVLAAECLHNRSAVMLDACFKLKYDEYTCVVDATTAVGRDIAVLFTGLLRHEFGEKRFRVQRIRSAYQDSPPTRAMGAA